jgi:predicted RNase H-like nuclease
MAGRAAMPGPRMTRVVGVDGCRVGWVAVLRRPGHDAAAFRLCGSFAEMVALARETALVALDMPIGLLCAAERGGRACDRLARIRLGWPRASSIFSPPVRGALAMTDDYRSALAANRASSPARIGISKQCFGLFPKLRAVDAAMTPTLQERVREAHPELAFLAMAGAPAQFSKRTVRGREERIELLRRAGLGGVAEAATGFRGRGWGHDDVIDAIALSSIAEHILAGTAIRLPEPPPRDARGLAMEIWA